MQDGYSSVGQGVVMGWFTADPKKALKKKYAAKMKEAKDAEKLGDRIKQSALIAEGEALLAELDALESKG